MADFWESFAPQASSDAAASGLGLLQGLIQGPQVAQKMDTVDLHNALLQAQAMLQQKKAELAGGPQLMHVAPGSSIIPYTPGKGITGPIQTMPNPGADFLNQIRLGNLLERQTHDRNTEKARDIALSPYARDQELAQGFITATGMSPQDWTTAYGSIPFDVYQAARAEANKLRESKQFSKTTGETNAKGQNPYTPLLKPEVGETIADVGRIPTATNPLTVPELQAHVEEKQNRKLGVAGAMSNFANVKEDPLRPGQFIGLNKSTGKIEHIPTGPGVELEGQQTGALSGDDFLKTLPTVMANQVKALAEGRQQFPSGFALKSPYWQNLIAMVSQYDPTFDAVNYNARAKTRAAFVAGPEAKSLNALNTVMGHMDNLEKSMMALDNTGFTGWNWLKNTLGAPFSPELKAKLNRVAVDKQAVASEFERAYRGVGGSMEDIKRWQQSFSTADSPEAMRAALEEGVSLLGSKIAALGDQYNKGMGTTKEGLELLSPKAQQVYKRLSRTATGPDVETQMHAGPKGPTFGTSDTKALYREYQALIKQGVPEEEARRRIGAKFGPQMAPTPEP